MNRGCSSADCYIRKYGDDAYIAVLVDRLYFLKLQDKKSAAQCEKIALELTEQGFDKKGQDRAISESELQALTGWRALRAGQGSFGKMSVNIDLPEFETELSTDD